MYQGVRNDTNEYRLVVNLGLRFSHPLESRYNVIRRLLIANPYYKDSTVLKRLDELNKFINVYANGYRNDISRYTSDYSSPGEHLDQISAPKIDYNECVRQCPICAENVFHTGIFNCEWLTHCPIHHQFLVERCPICDTRWDNNLGVGKNPCRLCGLSYSINSVTERRFIRSEGARFLAPYLELMKTIVDNYCDNFYDVGDVSSGPTISQFSKEAASFALEMNPELRSRIDMDIILETEIKTATFSYKEYSTPKDLPVTNFLKKRKFQLIKSSARKIVDSFRESASSDHPILGNFGFPHCPPCSICNPFYYWINLVTGLGDWENYQDRSSHKMAANDGGIRHVERIANRHFSCPSPTSYISTKNGSYIDIDNNAKELLYTNDLLHCFSSLFSHLQDYLYLYIDSDEGKEIHTTYQIDQCLQEGPYLRVNRSFMFQLVDSESIKIIYVPVDIFNGRGEAFSEHSPLCKRSKKELKDKCVEVLDNVYFARWSHKRVIKEVFQIDHDYDSHSDWMYTTRRL